MQSTKDPAELCWSCKQRPATMMYTDTHSKVPFSKMVCATCLDRLEVEEEYQHKYKDVLVPLENSERYDEALAWLDEFLEANRHRDHDQWLVRSIANHRAHILFDAGRYAEAEQACKAWADLGFIDVWRRWMHGSLTAATLDALGRPREGLTVLEEALSHQEPREIPSAWGYLKDLAKISKKLGVPVDPKWRSLAAATAAWHGVAMPEDAPLGEAIFEVAKAILKEDRRRRGEPEDDEDDEDEP